jgi:glutathione peroxidase-family protein
VLLKSLNKNTFRNTIILISIVLLASGCSSTRNFNEGQSLLKNYQIKGVDASLKEKITPFIRQKPNKKLFGISKVSLHLHKIVDRK